MKPTSHEQPGLGYAAQQRAQASVSRPQQAHARAAEPTKPAREIPTYAAPSGWTTSQKPLAMQHAFRAPQTLEQEKARPTWPQQQASIASTRVVAGLPTRTTTISGAELADALKLTDQQMQSSMGPIARRGYLYLTRFGSAMSLLGAGGAAAGIVAGGAGLALGIGLPAGGLAALAGVAVMLGGMAGSALAGAAARSISRSTLRDNPMLRQKMDTLRRMHGALFQKPQRTREENTLLTDVEAVLKRCDSSFASALTRTVKSALKAPLLPLLGANMIAQTLSDDAQTPTSKTLPGADSRNAVALALQGDEQFAMSPAMARWTHVLAATH